VAKVSWREELRKNWRQRLSALSLVLALIVLVDELVKENYSFDVGDLLAWPPFTHEQLFLLFLLLGLLLGLRVGRRRGSG
jgi:succinate dehydrogenase hydrophobic anchor subunit